MAFTDVGPAAVGLGAGVLPGLLGSTLQHFAALVVKAFFDTLGQWVLAGDHFFLSGLWSALSATTNPLISGSWFDSDFAVLSGVGAALVLPLLLAAVIQAIARQDGAGLLRTAFVRLPFALLFTAVVVQLVQLGLAATDAASAAVLGAGGDPSRLLIATLATAISGLGGFALVFVAFVTAVVSCLIWFELTVRSAAVAVATLFLPLALAGLAWPATAHWARRLGETLAALVLMKLVIAGVLALAVGGLADPSGGISGVMEGLALLALAAGAPFAMMRLLPMIESGAVGHLEGHAGRPVRFAAAKAEQYGKPKIASLLTGGTSSTSFGAGEVLTGTDEGVAPRRRGASGTRAPSGAYAAAPATPPTKTSGGDDDAPDAAGAGAAPPGAGGGPGGPGFSRVSPDGAAGSSWQQGRVSERRPGPPPTNEQVERHTRQLASGPARRVAPPPDTGSYESTPGDGEDQPGSDRHG